MKFKFVFSQTNYQCVKANYKPINIKDIIAHHDSGNGGTQLEASSQISIVQLYQMPT
jgi:hypothetical protein